MIYYIIQFKYLFDFFITLIFLNKTNDKVDVKKRVKVTNIWKWCKYVLAIQPQGNNKINVK
jgi:hypothetical protein